MPLRKAVLIGGIRFSAIPVQHSIRAPAVGYRVSANGRCFFYLPDIAELPKAAETLRGIDLYIGDGATVRRSMVHRKEGESVGHAPIVRQLDWCAKAHVRLAIFTHCGSPIVRAAAHAIDSVVAQLGQEHGLDARIACDGDRLSLRPRSGAIETAQTP
jgi:phosphoribosyl 1,2-cyclic phosphodiesterase